MKKRKGSQTTMENVARSIGSAAGIAVRTAREVADDVALAAKKVRATVPKKKARKKLVSRAKKLVGVGNSRIKTTTRKMIRTAKSARRAISKRVKR